MISVKRHSSSHRPITLAAITSTVGGSHGRSRTCPRSRIKIDPSRARALAGSSDDWAGVDPDDDTTLDSDHPRQPTCQIRADRHDFPANALHRRRFSPLRPDRRPSRRLVLLVRAVQRHQKRDGSSFLCASRSSIGRVGCRASCGTRTPPAPPPSKLAAPFTCSASSTSTRANRRRSSSTARDTLSAAASPDPRDPLRQPGGLGLVVAKRHDPQLAAGCSIGDERLRFAARVVSDAARRARITGRQRKFRRSTSRDAHGNESRKSSRFSTAAPRQIEDRLIVVADDHQRSVRRAAARPAESREQGRAGGVGVLKLVDEDVTPAPAVVAAERRVLAQQRHRVRDEIGKIHALQRSSSASTPSRGPRASRRRGTRRPRAARRYRVGGSRGGRDCWPSKETTLCFTNALAQTRDARAMRRTPVAAGRGCRDGGDAGIAHPRSNRDAPGYQCL